MATHHHINALSHGELMNPHMAVDSDPMLPVIRTSLHTTELKPDPTPSTDPELFDKSTGHPNTHYDHSKTLSKKKRAKMYGTSSPQQVQRPSNVKVDRSNVLDYHDAHEKVDHNKARDDIQEAYDHNIAKSKDAYSGREDEDLMTKRDEVSKADKPDEARKDHSVTTSDANKKKFANQQKAEKSDKSNKPSDKSSDKSKDKSSDKSEDKSDKSEDSEKSESMLGRAANLASGLFGSVKDKVLGKSDESSDAQQSSKEQSA